MDRVVEEEIKTFTSDNAMKHITVTKTLQDAKLFYEVKSNSGAIKELIDSKWLTHSDTKDKTISYSEYFNTVTTNIIKVRSKHSLTEALTTIKDVASQLGSNFAGALLLDGKHIYNVMHPLVALGIIDSPELKTTQFKIIVYTYNNQRKSLDSTYKSDLASSEAISANINALLATYTQNVRNRNVRIVSNKTEGVSIRQTYQVEKFPGEDMDNELFIVAISLLTRGIVAPHYGTALLQLTPRNGLRGTNLAPALSANIGYQSVKDGKPLSFNGVCTGSTPARTVAGMQTITHANLSSPLNTHVFRAGILPYIDKCISTSISLYEAANLITKEPTDG